MRTRKIYYQYFTNVSYMTCPECLAWHGRISRDPVRFPDRGDGCERRLLPFGRRELKMRRETRRRMAALARNELRRRELMREAFDLLADDSEGAMLRFRAAVAIDVYIPDLERLAREKSQLLATHDELRHRLRRLFSRAYSAKFGWPRYERLPEPMRIARERAGMARIDELFA